MGNEEKMWHKRTRRRKKGVIGEHEGETVRKGELEGELEAELEAELEGKLEELVEEIGELEVIGEQEGLGELEK